jgi:phosphate transport system substrate-binding protein
MAFDIRIAKTLLACLLLCLLSGSSRASSGGAILTYRGGAEGKVVFDGREHASKGLTCNDCHTRLARNGKQLFETRKRGLISLGDHGGDTKCFACHNGRDAFDDCSRCHRKVAP